MQVLVRISKIFCANLAAAVFAMAPRAFGRELESVSWDCATGTTWQSGTITEATTSARFTTSGKTILIPQGANVDILCSSGKSNAIPVKAQLKRSPLVKPELKMAPLAPPAPPPEPADAAPDVEEAVAPAETDPAPISDLSVDEAKALEELSEQQNAAFAGEPFRSIGLFLNLGRESIKGTGGNSEFSGTAGIGGTNLDFAVNLSEPPRAPIQLRLVGGGHNFTTEQATSDPNKDSEEKLTTTYQMVELTGLVGYSLPPDLEVPLTFEAGVASADVPIMSLSDLELAKSTLEMRRVTGGVVGLHYNLAVNPTLQAVAEFQYLLLRATGGVSSKMWRASCNWHSTELGGLYTILGLSVSATRSVFAVECPTDATNCKTSGEATDSKVAANMGAGVTF